MKVNRFLEERQASWQELRRLVDEARSRPERLGPDRVRRLGSLYRAAAADLSLARRSFPHDPVVVRLETLVGRARHLVYDAEPRRPSLVRFFTTRYWRLLAERPALLAVSAVLLLLPALPAVLWALRDPAAARGLVPEAFLWVAEPQPEGTDLGLSAAGLAGFSAFVFTNNLLVALRTFAGGVVWGLPAAFVLVVNGAILGGVVGLALEAGNGRLLVEAVMAHGLLELSCVVVAGAAGFRVGWALVSPGRRTRRQALVEEARAAVQIALGTAPWLLVAGLVEGYVSRTGVGSGAVTLIGVLLAGLFWGLLWWRGVAEETPAQGSGGG